MSSGKVAFGKEFFMLTGENTALIVIDMQNEFLEEGASLETLGRAIVPNLERLIRFCRDKRIPVVWTQSDHSYPYGGLFLEKFLPIKQEKVLWKGTRGFELYPNMIQPIEGEYRIVKHKFDCFYGTDLEPILKGLHVDTLIITGVATNVCCESAARSAFDRDYKVAFVGDATASFDQQVHEATLKNIDGFFGRVVTTDEVIQEIEAHSRSRSSA